MVMTCNSITTPIWIHGKHFVLIEGSCEMYYTLVRTRVFSLLYTTRHLRYTKETHYILKENIVQDEEKKEKFNNTLNCHPSADSLYTFGRALRGKKRLDFVEEL